MVVGIILRQLGVLSDPLSAASTSDPNLSERFAQYLVSGTYPGDLIEWKSHLPENVYAFLMHALGGASGFKVAEEYLSLVFFSFLNMCVIYFVFSALLYLVVFVLFKKHFLPNHYPKKYRILFDIKWSFSVIVFQSFAISALSLLVPRYSLVYYDKNDYPTWYYYLTFALHLAFNETWIYWTHYFGHYSTFGYTKLHWVHHVSVDFTPFSGWAFHPLDAFMQGCNIMLSCYFFPIHISVIQFYSLLGGLWSIWLHDNLPVVPLKFFMYSPNHTIHHIPGRGRLSNLGQMTTVWDRIMGTYEDPDCVDFGWQQYPIVLKVCGFFNSIYDFIVPDRSSQWKGRKIAEEMKKAE